MVGQKINEIDEEYVKDSQSEQDENKKINNISLTDTITENRISAEFVPNIPEDA